MRIAQIADNDRLLQFLRVHFYPEEPLTVGSEPIQQDEEDEKYYMGLVTHGTCTMAVMAICERENDKCCEKVVGAALAGPKYPDEADKLFAEAALYGPSKWGHTLQFLGCIERDANVFKRYGVDKALQVHVLGVDGEMRGRALGMRLMQELIRLGRQLGFPLMAVDCTSVYSAVLCARLGMELVNTVAFADYLDAEGRQVFKPPPPHVEIKTYAMRL